MGDDITFAQANDRLKEIVAELEDENMPLEQALDLYEEAVKLGSQVSSLIEKDITEQELAAACAMDELDEESSQDFNSFESPAEA